MSSIDDIKKRLDIDNLDQNARKDMFNKFVEKGGEIVQDKKQRVIQFNRDKQQQMLKQQNKRTRQQSLGQKNDSRQGRENNQQNQQFTYKPSRKKETGNSVKKSFIIFLTGFFQGIFTFNNLFSKKFAQDMQDTFSKLLFELKHIASELPDLELDKKWTAMDVVNLNNPHAFEILVRFSNIYDENDYEVISRHFSGQNPVISKNLSNTLFKIFKKLLIIYPYWETTKNILWESQQYYQDVSSIAPLMSKSKINKSIDRLYGYYLSKILTVINYNEESKVPFEYKAMFDFAEIKTEEDMGSITKDLTNQKQAYYEQLKKEKEEQLKKLQEDVAKKEVEKIPKYIQKGLTIIDKIIEQIPSMLQSNKYGRLFEHNEKMLQFFAIFTEFDNEYSFIMTTSQVKFTTQLEAGVKTDMKFELDNLYIKFNEILSLIKEYIKLMEQFKKIRDTLRLNVPLYEQERKKLEIKRSRTFSDIKQRSAIFFKKVAITLQKIIQDYDRERKLIQNGDDTLHFQLSLDKKPKFENFKIINAIILTFSFSSAIHFYITKGKLSEKGLYFNDIEEE